MSIEVRISTNLAFLFCQIYIESSGEISEGNKPATNQSIYLDDLAKGKNLSLLLLKVLHPFQVGNIIGVFFIILQTLLPQCSVSVGYCCKVVN